jgi:hypothetical protein
MTNDAVSLQDLTRPFVVMLTAVLSHATHDVQPEESARAERVPVTEVPDLCAGMGRKPTGEMASGRSLGS